MRHYIAVVHKDETSCYGVFFPDVKGVFTAGDTLEEAFAQAQEVLAFAAEHWIEDTASDFPEPRSIDELRTDPDFVESSRDAILMAIPFNQTPTRIAAE
ncbi:type II toxin-antitoxin system HicB family antitoxin [uncultured Bosea sp.]|jgi:predicted RNase H-like HicB family nuclease|uniref:type II toxin-antitoxin system HicB family antitoxin n=1 Tax=uncultured Bosea sp. TaxID=211457 RepID=UPI00263B7BB3|nr:type II toxin-antitoxin system HicB family antitoxin [uncultured Bosea sp.]